MIERIDVRETFVSILTMIRFGVIKLVDLVFVVVVVVGVVVVVVLLLVLVIVVIVLVESIVVEMGSVGKFSSLIFR